MRHIDHDGEAVDGRLRQRYVDHDGDVDDLDEAEGESARLGHELDKRHSHARERARDLERRARDWRLVEAACGAALEALNSDGEAGR